MDACENCGNCGGLWEERDITTEAQKILSCVARMKGRYGLALIAHTLQGADNLRVRELHLHELPTFGAMRGIRQQEIINITTQLIHMGYLAQSDGQFPTIGLTARAKAVLFEGEHVAMRTQMARGRQSRQESARAGRAEPTRAAVNPALLTELKLLRTLLARKQAVPAYVIFSDAALIDMCARLPKTPEEFLRVSGVGNKKLEQYGAAFLEVITGFRAQTSPPPAADPQKPFLVEDFIRQEPLPVIRFLDPLNAFLLEQGRAPVNAVKLTNRLLQEGYLEMRLFEGRDARAPGEKGRLLGIESTCVDQSDGNAYLQNLYGPDAQRLLAQWAGEIAGY